MAIEGPLKELSIQDVLQLMELSRKTGVLTVRSETQGDEVRVHFNRGEIVMAIRRRPVRRLGQQLLRAGKVTERELERALQLQKEQPGVRLGDVLLELGSVDEADLQHQLQFQLEETVYDLMAWDEGHFRFEEREELDPGRISVRIRVESLLMEGARRIDEWTRLESKIPSQDAVPVLAATDESDAGAPLELRPDEWEVLAEIDGERDIRQIAGDLGRSGFDVGKIIYGLVSMGVVQIQERRPQLPESELDSAIAEVERLLGAGELDAASRLAAELQNNTPDRAEVALLTGRSLAAQGRMRAATEAFARAVGLDPLAPEAHYHLGFAAVRIGELERAVRAWDNFLRLSPNGGRREQVSEAVNAVRALNEILAEATT